MLGNGAEQVLLGVGQTRTYLSGNKSSASNDFLRISSLNPLEDKLLLPGISVDYTLLSNQGSTELYTVASNTAHQSPDLMAVIDGLTGLSLGDGLFVYGSVALPDGPIPPRRNWSLDIDGSSKLEPQSDIALLLRFGLGTFPGASLQQDINNSEATRTDLQSINQVLTHGLQSGAADIDGNGTFEIFHDGLIALGYSIGITTTTMTSNSATRQSREELITYLASISPLGS